jgi:hypothetical protein
MVGCAISQAKPWRSEIGLKCHPDQVKEYNDFYQSRGIRGAHHEEGTGVCVCESRRARNQVLAARNLRDNDAGYGDHAGK